MFSNEERNKDEISGARGIFYAFLFTVLLAALVGQVIFLMW